MKALVIGASGATGKELIAKLLEDSRFTEVVIFARRNIGVSHPKLRAHIVDFKKSESWSDLVVGDVGFSCLGTTLKQAGSKEKQWEVDYQYQYDFARSCAENKVSKFVLVSAKGAHSNALFFYSKMKGQLEEAVCSLSFQRLVILRPSLLLRPNSDRAGERLMEKILVFCNKIGILKNYKAVLVSRLASIMIDEAILDQSGIYSVEASEISR